MTNRFIAAAFTLGLIFAGGPAMAAAIQINSAAALGSNDYFDWGQISSAHLASPVSITSNLGSTGSISDGAGFSGLTEGTDWFGNFTVGNKVLFTGDTNSPFGASSSFTVDLNAAVGGLGLQITSNFYGGFDASLEIFNGATSLGLFSVSGVMDGAENGSAPFLGAQSDALNINKAVFTLTSNTGAGLGVNRLLTAGAATPVPEPVTLSLFGAGLVGAVAMRRRKAKA